MPGRRFSVRPAGYVRAVQAIPTLETVVVIAKEPVPGRVKTRLVPPLTHADAAELAAAAISDTLQAAARVPAANRLLAWDGRPGTWVPAGWGFTPQPSGDLDSAAGRGLRGGRERTDRPRRHGHPAVRAAPTDALRPAAVRRLSRLRARRWLLGHRLPRSGLGRSHDRRRTDVAIGHRSDPARSAAELRAYACSCWTSSPTSTRMATRSPWPPAPPIRTSRTRWPASRPAA